MNKKLLRKLMLLKDAKANEKLASIADSLIAEIKKSNDNEEISDNLDTLAEFVYAVPDHVVVVSKFLTTKKPIAAKKLDRKYITGLYGKSHEDLILETLDLLNEIRYYKTKEVLQLLLKLSKSKNLNIKKRVDEIFKATSNFNYHALKQFGVSAQKSVIDFLEKNIDKLNPDSLKVLFSELLKPSFEGTEMKDEKTINWLTGPLVVNKELIEVRNRSISILFNLFDKAQTLNDKTSILGLLDNALEFPRSGLYKEDFEQMVSNDAIDIIARYEKIVFDKNGNIIAELPIVQEIETQLNQIIDRPIKKADKIAKKFISKLDKNEAYYISRLLTTSARDYRGHKNWEENEASRKTEIDKLFEKINEANIKKYIEILEHSGEHLERSESWEWGEYSSILVRISELKPKLAILILDSSSLIQAKFLTEMLEGFRKSSNWEAWDKYADLSLQSKETERIVQIFGSMYQIDKDKLDTQVRDADLQLLGNVIDEKIFSKSKNVPVLRAIMYALIAVYFYNPIEIESYIVKMFKNNNELMDMYLRSIELGIIRKQISLKGWNEKSLSPIMAHLTSAKNLDHDLQNVLVEIEKEMPGIALDILIKRIDRAISETREVEIKDRYEAIPDYFDDELTTLIRNNKDTLKKVKTLVEKTIENKHYIYGWKVNELVRHIGGSIRTTILNELVESKDEKKLEAAVSLLKEFESPDIDICFRIISNSSGPKSKVWDSVASRLYTTGVVTGEYGIRDYYKGVLKKIENIKNEKKKDQNVQKFADKMIKSFQASIDREEKRVKEDLLLRKIEFEN